MWFWPNALLGLDNSLFWSLGELADIIGHFPTTVRRFLFSRDQKQSRQTGSSQVLRFEHRKFLGRSVLLPPRRGTAPPASHPSNNTGKRSSLKQREAFPG